MKKGLGKGLGKGLDALLTYNEEAGYEGGGPQEIDVNKIEPSRDQPRKHFNEEQIGELAESIADYGIIQPLIVREDGEKYIIVAGERRWRAACVAGLETVPVIIRQVSELETLEIALIENIQREDLNPIEEATCYKRLNEEFSLNQEIIAKKVGKSRSYIANIMRLLRLEPRIQEYVAQGKLTIGHAKALMAIDDRNIQMYFAKKIVEEGLNVREAEDFVRKYAAPANQRQNLKEIMGEEQEKSPYDKEKHSDFQVELRTFFGTRVNIRDNRTGNGGGKIEINYFSQEDLGRIVDVVKGLRD